MEYLKIVQVIIGPDNSAYENALFGLGSNGVIYRAGNDNKWHEYFPCRFFDTHTIGVNNGNDDLTESEGKMLMGIDWKPRDDCVPQHGNDVLAWGYVPAVSPHTGSSFLGVTKYYFNRFGLDGTGHCGLVRVTHWAEITPPGG